MEKMTQAYSGGGLAEGTNANTIKTVATINFAIDGVMYSKGATDNLAIGVVGDNVAVPTGYECLYLVGLDNGGNVKSYQGTLYKQEVVDGVTKYRGYRYVKDGPTVAARYEQLSALNDYNSNFLAVAPDGVCPVGVVKVAPTVAATFTAGSTDLSAANVNPAYKDIGSRPVAFNF